MRQVREYVQTDGTCPFEVRFGALADARAKARINTAIRKLEGLNADVRSAGKGVHEARIDYGPGYRVYFGNDGNELVILLLCRDKRTQDRDISTGQISWADYHARKGTSSHDSKET